MIFRLSQKLAKMIKIEPMINAPLSANPFLDWTAHVFTAGRTQYVMVTNTFSLLSILFCSRGITDDNLFIVRTFTLMKEYLSGDPFTFFFPRVIGPYTNKVLFSKSTDRRVIGSMNDLIRNARYHLTSDCINPLMAAQKINEVPMSYLGFETPDRAFRRLRIPV